MSELQIDLTPEFLEEGPNYEGAAFGLLEIKAAGQLLTAAISVMDNERRYSSGPYVSGYHLAEWLVWNWWRLRWEPRLPLQSLSYDWDMSHRMPAIGEGYLWPNITIATDGFQCEWTSERSESHPASLFYYIGGSPVTVPATDFVIAVDRFVLFVLDRLNSYGIHGSNLQTLWDDLNYERNDQEVARFRRMEALLGFDPDQVAEDQIERWIIDAEALGENALTELAAATVSHMLSARQIMEATDTFGFDMDIEDAFRLSSPISEQWGQPPAWQIGVTTANAVRQQAGLGDQPIADQKLAELAGMSKSSVISDQSTKSSSWVLRQKSNNCRVAFRSPWKANRRFDLSRLVGDRLFSETSFTADEPLAPATRSYSYRQKAQRAFAAELLCPWEPLKAMLNNDDSQENREQAAEYFDVSQWTVNTQVANHVGVDHNHVF